MKHLALLLVFALVGLMSAAGTNVLSNIAEARSFIRDADPGTYPFDFRGQALSDSDLTFFFLRDETGGMLFSMESELTNCVHRGELLHIQGSVRISAGRSTAFQVKHVETLGFCTPPPPVPISPVRLSDNRMLFCPVTVSGVVFRVTADDIDSHFNWMVLMSEEGSVRICLPNRHYPLQELVRLVDADISVDGIISSFVGIRQNLGVYLSVRAADSLRVITPPPEDPFSTPELGGTTGLHRQKINGVVLATTASGFFIATARHHILHVTPSSGDLPSRPGERVQVAGFPTQVPFYPRLVDAVCRPAAGKFWRPEPRAVDTRQLFTNTNGIRHVSTFYHGQNIRLAGTVDYLAPEFADQQMLRLVCGTHTVLVDVSRAWPDADKTITAGSTVEVTGLCIVEFEHDSPEAMTFPRFKHITVIPRDPNDFKVLRPAPWWTPFRFLCVIGALIAALAAILVWSLSLRRLSERRGRQLAREQLRHAKSELKVEERTRLAVELHDSLSQTLTGVALQIDAAQGSTRRDPSAASRFLETARAMLSSCRQELRCCIWDLKSRTFAERNMSEAIEKTLAPHLGDVRATVRFNVPRNILSERAAHDILRIVRELAVNAIRHGHAAHLRIAGELDAGRVRFSVRDDGRGFDPSAVPGPSQGHFGLQGVRERLHDRNGSVRIDSVPGTGTKVTVSFSAEEGETNEG